MPGCLRALVTRLPPETKRKIKEGLHEIQEDPSAGKALVRDLAGLRSYRLGRMRIVYRHHGALVEVAAIGPRSEVYDQVARELRRAKVDSS